MNFTDNLVQTCELELACPEYGADSPVGVNPRVHFEVHYLAHLTATLDRSVERARGTLREFPPAADWGAIEVARTELQLGLERQIEQLQKLLDLIRD